MDEPAIDRVDVAPPDEAKSALDAGRSRTLARLRSVVFLALALPTIGYAIVGVLLYKREFAEARMKLDRASRVAAEHALKLFDTNEMLLQRMLDLLGERPDSELLLDSPAIHVRLAQMAAKLPQVQGLYVFDAGARMVASSRFDPPLRQIDYSDRAWFRTHLRGDVPLYFSEQITSRSTGEAAFDVSRRRVREDGGFAGTVNVSLRPDYLTDFYKELAAADPGLRLAVLRRDSAFIASWPIESTGHTLPVDDPLRAQLAAGQAAGESDARPPQVEGDSLRAFRRLAGQPVYVVASLDRGIVLAGWRQQMALLALFVFPTTIGFAWMAWVALLRTRDEFDTVQRLEEETARRQRAELVLVQSQKLEAMGRLTGGVAHDFNNLLAVVGSSLEVLRRLHPALAGVRQVDAIERAVTAGAKLTRQLLAFARKQALLPERVVLQERLGHLSDLLRPLLGSGVQLEWQVAEDTAPIEVDIAELELALINLAVNAADAMHRQGRLNLSARNALPHERLPGVDGEFVLIDVDDTGPGLDESVAARAFDPFFTTKPIGKGTGLGLSQVRGLCQSAGGDALIARAPAGGARVRLLLRRASAAAPQPAPTASPTAALSARVLLVEDNPAVASAVAELLAALGCRVEHASQGEQALDLLASKAERFDLVMSDIEMPGPIDGIALAERLRQERPGLPVILMTGYAPRIEQANRMNLSVLPKPCSAAVLGDAIRRAIST